MRMWLLVGAFVALIGLSLATTIPKQTQQPFNVYEASIASTLAAINQGQVTCEEIVSQCLDRIKRFDSELNVMVVVNTRGALEHARTLDKLFQSQGHKTQSALHCIPFILKDNIDAVPHATSAGVLDLANSFPRHVAPIAQRLFDAGAVLIGKANMPDFAMDGINTNSSRLGQTFNAYNNLVTPYGSSGGPAVAAAASYAVFVLGTDTNGSIQNPSSGSNLVGLRPTQFSLNTTGIVPLSSLQDTVGPMARSVDDARTVYEVMAQKEMRTTRSPNDAFQVGFLRFTLGSFVQPLVTIPDPNVVALANRTLAAMSGSPSIQITEVTNTSLLESLFNIIGSSEPMSEQCALHDFKYSVDSYLKGVTPESPAKDLGDVINSGKFDPSVLKYLLESNSTGPDVPTPSNPNCTAYAGFREKAKKLVEDMMDEMGFSVLGFASENQPPPFLENLNPPGIWLMNLVSAFTGLPVVMVPMGFVPPYQPSLRDLHSPLATNATFDPRLGAFVPKNLRSAAGWAWRSVAPVDQQRATQSTTHAHGDTETVPVGLTLLGRSGSEALLFDLAKEIERVYPQRMPPPKFGP